MMAHIAGKVVRNCRARADSGLMSAFDGRRKKLPNLRGACDSCVELNVRS